LIIARPAFSADGDTSHFDVFRALQHILRTEPQDRWALCLEQQPEFQALKSIAPRNQDTYRRLLEHPRLEELMIWMDALETESLTLTPAELSQLTCKADVIAQQDDALHPAHLAETFARLIPKARIHFVESGSSSDEAYRESMQKTLNAVLTD
jgi:pimeloyl-ACP methyl ester carboxylesterase